MEERKIVRQFYISNERANMLPNLAPDLKQILLNEGGRCTCLEVSYEGIIIAGCTDGTIRIFNLYQDKEEKCLHTHQNSVDFVIPYNVNVDSILTGSNDGIVKLWSISLNEVIESWNIATQGIKCGMFTSDGQTFIAGCSDGTLSIFNVSEKKEKLKINAHLKAITGLIISPDGKRIVTGSEDGMVKIFCANTLRELLILPHNDSIGSIPIGFSPDMRFLFTINARSDLMAWDSLYKKVNSKQDVNVWKNQRHTEYRKP
jgi:WD40 repeat protein